mmetsp:Transcript_26909/g.65415  ORF Transcript_26909/g.65415 Transcript_26909/m.65415 type:complete len:317 (-) Transcript_26909:1637-2587(-)
MRYRMSRLRESASALSLDRWSLLPRLLRRWGRSVRDHCRNSILSLIALIVLLCSLLPCAFLKCSMMTKAYVMRPTSSTRVARVTRTLTGTIVWTRQCRIVRRHSSNDTLLTKVRPCEVSLCHMRLSQKVSLALRSDSSCDCLRMTFSSARITRSSARSRECIWMVPSGFLNPIGWGKDTIREVRVLIDMLPVAPSYFLNISASSWTCSDLLPSSQEVASPISSVTSSVMKAKLSRIIPTKRLSMICSQTSMKMMKKTGAAELPQSPKLRSPYIPEYPGAVESKRAVHSGGSTETSMRMSCHSSPVTIWNTVRMLMP